MANPRTIAKIAARIKERVAYCLEFEINDPRSTFLTVTRVEVAKDLSSARVFYSVLGTEGDRSKAAHMLESARGFVQRQVARVLNTRRTPRILWEYDSSIEYAAEMDQRIKEALDRDRSINPTAHADVAPRPVQDDDADHMVAREYEEFLESQDSEKE